MDSAIICNTNTRELKMRWSLRQAWPFQRHYVLREVWDVYRRTGKHLCVCKAYIISRLEHVEMLSFLH